LIIGKPVYALALLVVALSLLCELWVPGADYVIGIAAVLSGLATWIVPLLLIALSWSRKPQSSLAGVGFTIRIFVAAACFSAIGVWLALLTLVFAQDRTHAWIALFLIGVFWLWVSVMLHVGDRQRQVEQDRPKSRLKRRFKKRLRKRSK
jgi:MFS family permease